MQEQEDKSRIPRELVSKVSWTGTEGCCSAPYMLNVWCLEAQDSEGQGAVGYTVLDRVWSFSSDISLRERTNNNLLTVDEKSKCTLFCLSFQSLLLHLLVWWIGWLSSD